MHHPQRAFAGAEAFFIAQELGDEHLRPDVQDKGPIFVEFVQRPDGQHGQEQRRLDLGGVEGGRVQEGEVVVEMVEVIGQVDVQLGAIAEGEGGLQLGFGLDLLDALADQVELRARLDLRGLGFGEGLDRARRLAVIDGGDGTLHEGEGRESARGGRTGHGHGTGEGVQGRGQGVPVGGVSLHRMEGGGVRVEGAVGGEGELRQLRIMGP